MSERCMHAVAPEMVSMQQSVSVLEGDTLTIPCEATGRPNPLITWTAPHSQPQLADYDDDLRTVSIAIQIFTCNIVKLLSMTNCTVQ